MPSLRLQLGFAPDGSFLRATPEDQEVKRFLLSEAEVKAGRAGSAGSGRSRAIRWSEPIKRTWLFARRAQTRLHPRSRHRCHRRLPASLESRGRQKSIPGRLPEP